MVRKRIADLLNEEGEKLTTEQSSSELDATNNEELSNEEKTEVVKPTRTTARSRNTSRTRQASQNTSDSEGIVTELRAALKQAQENEHSLEHRIAELLVELEDEKALVKQLRQDVANFDAVNAELDQAKTTILQLAEANSKLIEQMNSLKKEPAPLQRKEPAPLQKKEPAPPQQQKYKSARQTVVFPQQDQVDSEGQSVDFARNTWLL
jgi:chromosome segregation ATPase